MTYCEVNNYYKQIYGKDFPRATLTKWVKEGAADFDGNLTLEYSPESYTGTELKEAPARAGSMAAYQIKSRGF